MKPLLLSLLLLPAPSRAQVREDEIPRTLRWMLEPAPYGMLVRLPVIDTDPNRGVTAGVMPTWVLRERGGSAVRHIHAPSVTYNGIFRITGTYRYFYYPRPDTNLLVRLSASGHLNREAVVEYHTHSFLDRELRLYGRFDYSIDGSNRFFGIGPDTPEAGESNYTLNTLKYRFHFGVPFGRKARSSPTSATASRRPRSRTAGSTPSPASAPCTPSTDPRGAIRIPPGNFS